MKHGVYGNPVIIYRKPYSIYLRGVLRSRDLVWDQVYKVRVPDVGLRVSQLSVKWASQNILSLKKAAITRTDNGLNLISGLNKTLNPKPFVIFVSLPA